MPHQLTPIAWQSFATPAEIPQLDACVGGGLAKFAHQIAVVCWQDSCALWCAVFPDSRPFRLRAAHDRDVARALACSGSGGVVAEAYVEIALGSVEYT